MRKTVLSVVALLTVLTLCGGGNAQDKKKSGFQEVYTGTIASMNGPLRTTTFNLSIKEFTTDDDVRRYLSILAEGDQDDLLKEIRNLEMGRLSSTRTVGRSLIVARKVTLPDGRTRIVAAFERWQTFAELRSGGRLEDYPFGLMEIILDKDGKKGSGTFIAACKIDMKLDKKTGKYQLELENFGTYPNKVMGVMRRD